MRFHASLAVFAWAATAAAADHPVVFLRADLPSQPVYRNELFLVDVQVHFPGFSRIPIDLNELRNHPPRLQASSVSWLMSRPVLREKWVTRNGKSYPVYHYFRPAVARHAGDMKLIFQTELIVVRRIAGIDKSGKHEPKTAAQTLTVKPLPLEGQPDSFTGAVGEFSVHLNVDKTRVRVNNPVELTVTLQGKGALDHVTMPEPDDGWGNFRVDRLKHVPVPPQRIREALPTQFTKRFRVRLLPRAPGPIDIPPLRFSFFNPNTEKYHVADTQPIPLEAFGEAPIEVTPDPPVVKTEPGGNPVERKKLAQKKLPGVLAAPPPPLLEQPWFLAAQATPLLAWVIALTWRRRRDYYDARPRLARRLRVEKLLRQDSRKLDQRARAGDAEDFYQLAGLLLRERIGERLDIPAGGITEAVLKEELAGKLPEAAMASLGEFLETSNAVRFGPATVSGLATARARFHEILAALQNLKDPADEI